MAIRSAANSRGAALSNEVKPVIVLLLSTALGVLLGLWLARDESSDDAAFVTLEQPRTLPEFELRGSAGKVTRASLLGSSWWVVFGYTSCPDICPTTLATLAIAGRELTQAHARPPRVLFVSVDPARDSPAALRRYLSYLTDASGRAAVGVTGSDAQLRAFAATFGLGYRSAAHDGERDYAVTHSAVVVLIDDCARVSARLLAPFTAHDAALTVLAAEREKMRAGCVRA